MSGQVESSADFTGKLPEVVCVRPACSRDEFEQAFRLVYQNYLLRGYAGPDPSGLRVIKHIMVPEAATFVGVLDGSVIATVSLVPDTELGLPMDSIYADRLQPLRDQGRRLTEVTMLADRRLEINRTLPMLLNLMKLVFDYARFALKADDLCITINPRHEAFYRRYLLFADLGEERGYPSVEDYPALAKRLDLGGVRALCKGHEMLERVFFEQAVAVEVFEKRYALTCDDLHYFFLERTRILAEASEEDVRILREMRPTCPWEGWMEDIGGRAD